MSNPLSCIILTFEDFTQSQSHSSLSLEVFKVICPLKSSIRIILIFINNTSILNFTESVNPLKNPIFFLIQKP